MILQKGLPSTTFLLSLIAVVLAVVLIVIPRGTAQQTQIKEVANKPTNPDSGKDMYMQYCAACHGRTAKGDGPAASALKVPAADLTQLAKKNDGNYPGIRVGSVLQFSIPVAAHGSKDMPVWGRLFESLSAGNPTKRGESNARTKNITDYLESLQAR
jgi:mono/diheme cytochrome c family protein